MYLYCLNDPVNFVDMWGLCAEKAKVGFSVCPRYGNWGGLDWSGGTQIRAGEIGPDVSPVDQMDASFRQHDIAGYIGYHIPDPDFADNYINSSNIQLYRDLRQLHSDPKLWNPPAKNIIRAKIYKNLAELYLLLVIND
jgi:hypothetical protein